MGTDKRDRHRLKRARKRKARARQEAQRVHAVARHIRTSVVVDEVHWRLEDGDFVGAADAAARAAALQPYDRYIASLYVEAAEGTGDVATRQRALAHLCRLPEPPVQTLISLAHLYLLGGDRAQAAASAARARAAFPRRINERTRWLRRLTSIEQACGEPAPTINEGRSRPSKESTLSLFPTPSAPKAAIPAAPSPRGSTTQVSFPLAEKSSSRPAGTAPHRADPALAADTAVPSSNRSATAERTPHSTPDPRGERGRTDAVAAPATLEIPIVITAEIEGLDGLAGALLGSAEDVRLAVLAAQIRAAESFDRLLALERAHGLLRFSHQEETARKVLSTMRGRALLADEVGLGKTIEAGLVLSEYVLRGLVHRALILTPLSLVAQWREELTGKFGIDARTTDDGAFRTDPEGFWSASGVVIASLPTARSARQRTFVTSAPWDVVIVDEAHALKNVATESHALVAEITSRFLLLLTATPVENRADELYNLVSLIRPGHLGSRGDFVRRFADTKGRPNEAARREVETILGDIMVRNTRALSGVQLPPRFAHTVLVPPTASEAELYEHLVTALRALGPTGSTRLLLSVLLQEAGSSTQAVRNTLERIARDPKLSESVASALAPAIACAERLPETGKGMALMRALDGTTPAVVFTRFRATLEWLAGVMEKHSLRHERVDGDMPMRVRHEAIARCRRDGGVLLSTEVGSEGLNLQFCKKVINFDLPWNPARIEQRIGRVHRIGQDHPVEIINFCLAGSIEERVLRILDERINLFELVVGEVETILGYLETEREFADLVLDAFAEPNAAAREGSFDRIADALAAARKRYENVKTFDEAFFRNALGV